MKSDLIGQKGRDVYHAMNLDETERDKIDVGIHRKCFVQTLHLGLFRFMMNSGCIKVTAMGSSRLR